MTCRPGRGAGAIPRPRLRVPQYSPRDGRKGLVPYRTLGGPMVDGSMFRQGERGRGFTGVVFSEYGEVA